MASLPKLPPHCNMSLNNQSSENRVRVAIIGAGISGVTAANSLISSGKFTARDICVLEASSRIGGRIETRKFSSTLPMNLEIGAAWIHGTEGNPFIALAKKFGIQWKEVAPRNPWLHPIACSNFLMFDGADQLTDEEVKETCMWQETLLEKLQELRSTVGLLEDGATLTSVINELVEEDEDIRAMVASAPNGRKRIDMCVRMFEVWMGLTSDELQIADNFAGTDLVGDDPGAHCIVPAGMERFIDGLAAPIRNSIRTNMCVTSINYESKDKVVIECANGEVIVAEYAVVTSSLGYLKSKQLKFQPELPAEKQGAMERSKMGQYMKVLVQFPSVFWPEDAIFLAQLTDNAKTAEVPEDSNDKRVYFPCFFNYYYAKGAPVLEAQIVGEKAQLLSDTMTDEEIARAMYLQLKDTFGSDIPEPVGHFVTHWDQNKWSVGAYSCNTVGSTDDDPDLLRQPLGKRVYFAGEATDYKYQGALQAAYFTGRQAADEIVGEVEECGSKP